MRMLRNLSLATVFVLVVLAGFQLLASESNEVVVLTTTPDDASLRKQTRLWIVDVDGKQWLRAGRPGSGWYLRVDQQPVVTVTRGGITTRYTAVPMPAQRDVINAAFAAKYGWADSYVSRFAPRDDAIPIRLVPPKRAAAGAR